MRWVHVVDGAIQHLKAQKSCRQSVDADPPCPSLVAPWCYVGFTIIFDGPVFIVVCDIFNSFQMVMVMYLILNFFSFYNFFF